MLLPILINIFLIIANLIAAWGAINNNHMFLIPWLAAYFSYILFAFGLLLYMVIVLYHVWFKIVIFLIVSPILILAIVFWLTLLELYFNIKMEKHNNKKMSQPPASKLTYPSVTSKILIPPHSHNLRQAAKLPPLPSKPLPNGAGSCHITRNRDEKGVKSLIICHRKFILKDLL